MNFDPFTFLSQLLQIDITRVFKLVLLLFIGLYAIFAFMLFNKIRSLDKIVFFPQQAAGAAIKILAFLYLLIVLSLFVATLVIV